MLDLSFHLIFSSKSFEDLHQMQTYTKLTFGERQQFIYEENLKTGFAKIAKMPSIGHTHKQLPSNVMVFNIEKHIVIYTISEADQNVYIVRIVHQFVDLSSILDQE